MTTVVLLTFAALLFLADRASAQAVPPTCPARLGTEQIIRHNFSVSFCELCEVGTARIVVENRFRPGDDLDFSDIIVDEDLRASGLTYVANSTNFSGSNITVPADFNPTVGGANGSNLRWDFSGTGFVMDARPGGAGNRARLRIDFQVERHSNVTEEGLIAANRTIEAAIELTPSCAPADRFSTDSGPGVLPLREPEPQIIKLGRNLDAGQGAGSYSDPVYGHEDDDVIWRIEVRNNGLADLQDFEFSDSIVPGNFDIDFVCDNEGDATSVANGGAQGDCRALPGNTTSISNFDVAAEFGNGANPYIVAPAGGRGFYYLVGKITNSCLNRINTVSGVEWGCQVEAPPGGIAATSNGTTAGDSALLSALSVESGLDVNVALTGVNTGQPMGARGTVTITVTNNSGGTVLGGANGLKLRNLLPAEYVIDTTFAPTVVMSPAYGSSYPGMVDTITWTNPAANTFPLVTADPALPLSNVDLSFDLTSSTVHPDFPAEQFDMIRHGDVVTVTFRTVLIDPQYYDLVANLDVRDEAPNSTPTGTDPTQSFPITSRTEIWFEDFCAATGPVVHHLTIDENDVANPEDLEVDIAGSELIFILTNTGDPLPLTVELSNDGGHDATDYFTYVTFGEAMVVQTVPSGCAVTTNPAARPIWQTPTSHPPTAAVYECDRGTISPGETQRFNFEVVKNTAATFDDDLTFRADVIGEIALSDGTLLWFPTPTARPDGITDRANDYSVDAIWARVIGYNLFKDQLGLCSENNLPPNSPDIEIEIGEQCRFHVESGGWFGFETPGFTYIAVQNIQVVDELPNGQGYISSSNPLATSTSAIQGVSLNPPPVPLSDAFFDWTFNTAVPAERITEKDHWFRVDLTTRLLNDPIDTSAAPNDHAAISTNIMTSTFDAVFFNQVTSLEEVYNLGPNTIGFPREVHRRVDLTVTEPNLTVTKLVCNETRYGIGSACGNFVALADDGDAFDTYVYQITVENEGSSGGVTRAPAYDVTVTSISDPSDQLFVDPLTADNLDNDSDSLVDAGDLAGEGVITDNVIENGVPAQIIASYTHSDALRRIGPGESVVLYYRVDPDDDVAPLQQLVGTATASYDSLENASGAQTAPQGANGEIGGARQYVSAPGQATIRIIPVEVPPKQVLRVSNSALVLPVNPQPIVIGEEVEFQIRALIPVAQLRNFMIRDQLPTGMSCTEALAVDLGAPPYDAAGFVPGGVFTPTCTDTDVVWNFGDQTVTQSNRVDRRFDFGVEFIARVDNLTTNREGDLLRNGGTSTVTEIRYVDEGGNPVTLPVDEAVLVVREPVIDLVKTFSVLEVDAGDLPRVLVEATNSGTTTAYNLRVMDDLTPAGLSYAGAIQGSVPPTEDLVTLGPDMPIFSWPSGISIAPGETVSFSFAVEVDPSVEPGKILSNTIDADWTSLPSAAIALNLSGTIGPDGSPTGMRNGAIPNAGDALNDYEAQATATVPVAAVAVTKIDLDPAQPPEIGVHKSFEVEVLLPEGMTTDLVASDALDFGAVSYVLSHNTDFDITYEFVGITSINGLAPDEAALTAIPGDATSGTAVWAIGTVITESEDDLAIQMIDPVIRIRYFARLNNDLVTNVGSTLQNSMTVNSIHGETGLQATVNATTAPVVATESSLTATKVLTNVTPGKVAADPPAFNDTLQYAVTVINGGNAMAHDVNVVDTLPPELALSSGFTPTASIDTVLVAGFVGLPTGAPDGPLLWGRQNGDNTLDIAPGSFLELTYQVVVRAPPADGAIIENNVFVDWTSLDASSVYERTGAGCPTITAPNDYCFGPAIAQGTVDPAPTPNPLLKENTQANAAVGEAFRYRITVPETPYAFPVYDVRIFDDLAAAAADLRFLSVSKISGSAPFTPVNTGTATNLVLEDTAIGIDIPAGEQVVLEITVVLEDTPTNVSGLTFLNSATYLYNWLDGNSSTQRVGAPGATLAMTIVGPDDLTLEKSGPPSMSLGSPATFTLNVHNTGTGPAWNVSILDQLANTPLAGTCDLAPAAFTARVFEADGVTAVSAPLVEGTDFSVLFRADPDCDFTLTALSPAAVIGADQRLIVSYDAVLDADSEDGNTLTNIAASTEWFSADGTIPATAGDRRSFTRLLTDGTVAVLDHEDAYSSTVALPAYLFEKTVMNVTTLENPATTASPGDRLRYRLRVENLRAEPLTNLTITDELDRLNGTPVFEPGTLVVVTEPTGADSSNTNDTGGAAGTGFLDVRGLNLPALNDTLIIEFEVTLAGVIANATFVTNQSQLLTGGVPFADSDDPNVGGPADPFVPGDEDPTQVPVSSAPNFKIEKISTYLTGDPAILLAGETLRYTITVKNIGTDSAVDATLRDSIPVNTSYVVGTTSLNGVPIPDGMFGTSPLSGGILINAPEDLTPGVMRADVAVAANNVATIIFDVIVDPAVIDGTIISNQSFVSAILGGLSDQPSDDPRTPILDDPTRDVVGNSPLLFAVKSAALLIDLGSPGVVDPGDVLRYTISVQNSGAMAATEAVLADNVPANTTYVANSLTLNGLPVGQPDGGISPLIAGIPISSSDLSPPLPGPGLGMLNPGENATIEFDLSVNAGVPGGTIITNQAIVQTLELPNLLTDGDGNPATGPEPTQVVVGNGQQLSITKQVSVVGGGAALAGSELEYVVRIVNIATVPANNVVLTDDLDLPTPAQLSYVAGSATLNGSTVGVTFLGSLITADYSTSNGPLAPGGSVILRFRARLDAGLAMGTTVVNTGVVIWNLPPQTASASVSIAVGGMPGIGALNGTVWHDADFDRSLGGSESELLSWVVDLYRNGQFVQSALTDGSGNFRIGNLAPNDVSGDQYQLRFSGPGAGANTAAIGRGESAFTNGLQRISDIIVPSGSNLQALNLPIDPNGVVYDSVLRTPLAGAALTMLNANTGAPVAASCFDDPVQQGQVTRGDGYYKFDLNFSSPSCSNGGDYVIEFAVPNVDYVPGTSVLIPALTDATTTAYSVPICSNDAVVFTAQHCEVQASEFAPPPSVPARTAGTNYHLHLTLDSSLSPGSSQLFNNHIPLDPVLGGVVAITKTTPSINVSRGDLIPYEITFDNSLGVALGDLTIVDRYPAGLRYIEGSARIDGVEIEPTINGRELVWTNVGVAGSTRRTLVLLLAVGAGVTEGEFVNRVQAISGTTGLALSGEATATVRVVPDPTFDCTDVLGKVFDDVNQNGEQDGNEKGLSGIRLMTMRGLAATTDQYGRFHITCAIVPNEERGSNFVLKLDDRTLPSGYRMSTRQTQVKRATRGKALSFEFGASIHRVVALDLADAVFEPGSIEMRTQWKSRLTLLLDELEKKESILRLSYLADIEDPQLVERRLEEVKSGIIEAWEARDGYSLEIETEIYWRRSRPSVRPAPLPERSSVDFGLPHVGAGPPGLPPTGNSSTERIIPTNEPLTKWALDPEALETELGDRLEEREVTADDVKIVKLTNVVPPVRFASGVADISPDYVRDLQAVLAGMQHLDNVRLHLVGHSDDQPLSPALARLYGNNEGLSRERAGEVAEFLQSALMLPPESISFGWAGDKEPVASNATEAGRLLNRRVEVEVWYDEIESRIAIEEVVIHQDIKRFKVCRTETLCKLRYREGNAHRARVKNLIEPIYYEEDAIKLDAEFIRQVKEALYNLRDKQNVTVKFIGFTDDVPLTGRAARIYGTHLALSKARAHRAALALKDILDLPTAGIASDGRGSSKPLSSNATEHGRGLNRRIEVEFWHDDPLQELPDDLQMCPDPADAELIARVYDPPWGRLESIQIENGEPVIPEDYADDLRRAMRDVEDRKNVRLRFVGYTGNQRLDRRTAIVYGDDIGLSVARARRTMEQIKAQLDLSDAQTEHEGRGFVQSDDVVNGGFQQGASSYVDVQVVFDELAVLEDYEGVEVTRVTRELRPQEPLALNLMRITVDGEPIDDPGRNSADIQRCTDVAFDKANMDFRFDGLKLDPRLSVTSVPSTVRLRSTDGDRVEAAPVQFQMYTNYAHFIERSEVRVFGQRDSLKGEPLDMIEFDRNGRAVWHPEVEALSSPVRILKFVLRVYASDGTYDETAPQPLWVVNDESSGDLALSQSGSVASDDAMFDGEATPEGRTGGRTDDEADEQGERGEIEGGLFAQNLQSPGDTPEDIELLAGYGESEPATRNIALDGVSSVEVRGGGIPADHTVWLAGSPVPVDENGNFIGEVLLPSGAHTVEVAVLDEEGNGELFLRDLEFDSNEWFYMAIADLTLSVDLTDGANSALGGNNSDKTDAFAEGRLAFYTAGKWGEDWKLTASADTREGPLEDIFSNFLDKTPDALFRRLDPDYYYSTFGDDGVVEETAPTLGKLYVKLSKGDDHFLWGNFVVAYDNNELALVERGLYGANALYQVDQTTRFGERRAVIDGFAADSGTVPSREEFRGTGGSLYFLKRRDLLIGSERLRIEIRDKDSGLVSEVVRLQPEIDYDIDYIQGRILLNEPLSTTVDDQLLVRDDGLSGNEVWLLVQYEYTPGFDNIDALNAGGQGHVWLNDFVKIGMTANKNEQGDVDSSLYAADLTLRTTTRSWVKFQAARSKGPVSTSGISDDGGFSFADPATLARRSADAYGYRADFRVQFSDFLENLGGHLSLYAQRLEADYSAPGLNTLTDTDQYGGVLEMPLGPVVRLNAKADRVDQDRGLKTTTAEVDVAYHVTDHWSLQAGVRYDDRDDSSVVAVATQEEGERTDGVLQIDFDSKGLWKSYAFGQATLQSSGNRDDNRRGGVGGSFRVSDRLAVDGEVSHGDLGLAAKAGTTFQQSERSRLYLNYALDNERSYDGLAARQGSLIVGTRSRLSDSTSVFFENQYQHSSISGLTRSVGIDYKPTEQWSLSGNWESGKTRNRQSDAKTERRAAGASIGFNTKGIQLSSAVEYIYAKIQQFDGSRSDRTTWLFRNNLSLQMTPDWRFLAKANHAISDSSQGEFFDGGFTEAVLGFAFRPVSHNRLYALAKYTYFYNVPGVDQVNQLNVATQFIQKSHVAALDVTYKLTNTWSVGGKYAYRSGQISLDRVNKNFTKNDAHLYILRADWRFRRNWEGTIEGRLLDLPDLDEYRAGSLVTLYRYFGEHFKVGIGYNFTDFSEDLTDLSYDKHGIFFNMVGTL